jgi:predicted Zn-dependent peptidase
MTGRYMRQFNSVERISHSFISVHFKGVSMFDYLDVYDKISFEYVNEVFREHFDEDNMAMSVIKPI